MSNKRAKIEKAILVGQDKQVLEGSIYNPSEKNRSIIFFHGYGAVKEHYRNLFLQLSRNSKVIVFDMRGHGKSGEYLDLLKAGEDAAKIIETYSLFETKIIMHSTGFIVFLLAFSKLKRKKSSALKNIKYCYALSPLLALENLAPYASLSSRLLSKISPGTQIRIDDFSSAMRLDKLGFLPRRPVQSALELKRYHAKSFSEIRLPLYLFLPKNDLILGLFNRKQRKLYSDTVSKIFPNIIVDESLSVNHNYRLIGNFPFGDRKTIKYLTEKISDAFFE
jgi:pimeloyl-ACP methyl ester carboxylesterase